MDFALSMLARPSVVVLKLLLIDNWMLMLGLMVLKFDRQGG